MLPSLARSAAWFTSLSHVRVLVLVFVAFIGNAAVTHPIHVLFDGEVTIQISQQVLSPAKLHLIVYVCV